MSSNVILVTGFARTGKDTLARAMSVYNPKYMPVSFAEPLKRACNATMIQLDVEIDFFKEEDKVANRDVLIEVAKSARRKDKDVFAKILSKKIGGLLEIGYSPVISDWRYINEHEVLLNTFGKERIVTVNIMRDGSKAAAEEELKSITEITSKIEFNYSSSFKDGDVESVINWGFKIAQENL